MLALDLDGTLAIENHQILAATRSALSALHDSGVEVVIATGRRYRTTRYVIGNLGFEVFAVCNGGALIKTPKQSTLHREAFDVGPIVKITRQAGLTIFAQRDAHDLGGPDFVLDNGVTWNSVTDKHYKDNKNWSGSVDLLEQPPEFLVSGLFGEQGELEALAQEIHRAYPDAYNTIVVSHLGSKHFYCEITQKHVDKWSGLTRLTEHLNITAENVCAVGDEMNDMAMVQGAGHGIAMGNGHPELKEAAQFVCGNNDSDGLLDAINYVNNINESASSKMS